MEKSIPQDDLQDVMEMTDKLEKIVSNFIEQNEINLVISALMSSTINSILIQCKSLEEAVFYRNMFVEIFDESINSLEIKEY